jgi:hypothetical protein
MVEHSRIYQEKATHLLFILLEKVVILHNIHAGTRYEDILVLKGLYEDHQLAAAYHSQQEARNHLTDKSVQEFAVHCALVGLPQDVIWREVAHALFDRIRDQEMKFPSSWMARGH